MYNVHVLGYIISMAFRTYPSRAGDIFVLCSTANSVFFICRYYELQLHNSCTWLWLWLSVRTAQCRARQNRRIVYILLKRCCVAPH